MYSMGSLSFVGCPMLPAIVNLNQSEKLKGSYLKIKETKCYSSLQCKTIKILPTNIKLQTVKSVHFKNKTKSADAVLKMITILKEMRIAQL